MAERARALSGLGLIGGRTLAVLAACVIAVGVAEKSGLRVDASASSRFTLAPELARIIDDQDAEIELVGIWSRRGSDQEATWVGDRAATVERYCRLIAERSADFTYRHIDAVLDRPEREAFSTDHGDARSPVLYVVREGREAFPIPITYVAPQIFQRELGGALVALARETATRCYVLQGHGELRPEGGRDDGCGHLLRRIRLAGYEVRGLDPVAFSRLGRIPDDGILLIPGPTAPLGGELVGAIERFLVHGGAALLLGDDRFASDLAALLRVRGIFVGPGYPRDYGDDHEGHFDPRMPGLPVLSLLSIHSRYGRGRHAYQDLILETGEGTICEGTTDPDRPTNLGHVRPRPDGARITQQTIASGRYLFSPRSTPVRVVDLAELIAEVPDAVERYRGNDTPPFAGGQILTFPAGDAWLAPYPEAANAVPPPPEDLQRLPGYNLAWSVEYEPHPDSVNGDRRARIVVWGSRQAASDGVVAGGTNANEMLLVDALAWLSRRGAETPIPAKSFQAFRVECSPTTLFVLMGLLIAVIPCCFLGAAMIAWWERRN